MDVTDSRSNGCTSAICHVQPIQMYQLPPVSTETASTLPFKLLTGEAVFDQGTSVDGLIVLTNYRLYLQSGENHHHVPLGLVEAVEHKELFYLHVGCKDARTYRCVFANNESCLKWYDRIAKAAEPPRQLEQIFAFYHFIWAKDRGGDEVRERMHKLRQYNFNQKQFKEEMNRLQFEGDSWRISEANKNFKLCPTYPPLLIVPSCINDETLEAVAKFRSSRRVPAVVWRHARNGAVVARCSQPEVGWLGWRSAEDEELIRAISQACNFDQRDRDRDGGVGVVAMGASHSPGSLHSDSDSLHITSELGVKEKKVLIMDARSYTTAVANRARGGGCECPEYYPNCEIQFMNLANIHSIRKSFHALRLLCTGSADQPNWFSQLEGTRWLQHMSGLMKAAVTLVSAVEVEARPVMVHCSDGWDRTPQIVALAELLLDPYYRTIDGFRILIEREWLAFGHKFADRCGHSTGSDDQNERCPVFLQWLDCIHQLVLQFSCAFEFSHTYLVKLAQHIYSNLYGTFLCNTLQERMDKVNGKTFAVWEFLGSPRFRNHLYAPPGDACGSKVLWPQCNVRDLHLWREVYLGSWEAAAAAVAAATSDSAHISSSSGLGGVASSGVGGGACPGPPDPTATTANSSPFHSMTKTRSYGDLMNASTSSCLDHPPASYSTPQAAVGGVRRSSDPSIINLVANVHKEASPSSSTTASASSMRNGGGENGHFLLLSNGEEGGDYFGRRDVEDDDDDDDDDDEDEDEVVVEKVGDDVCDCDRARRHGRPPLIAAAVTRERGTIDREGNDVSDLDDSKEGAPPTVYEVGRSIETSTDTLVSSDNQIISSSPLDVNGFEKVQSPVIDDDDDVDDEVTTVHLNHDGSCRVCAQHKRILGDSYNNNSSGSSKEATCSSRRSRYSSYSRTSSSSGWDNGLPTTLDRWSWHHPYSLGDDGLAPARSIAQERLWQIIEEHKKKEELLEKELHKIRQVLIKQVCHKCNNTDCEKIDDSSNDSDESRATSLTDDESSSSKSAETSQNCSSERIVIHDRQPASVVESVCSVGEGQASAVESLRSDSSWEALEDNGILTECPATLWVPDHAVSRCTGCQTEFWVGKRKHHCRKCGRIFCASCSENSTPLPSEQLYNPVRVCTGCYSKLRRDCTTSTTGLEDAAMTTVGGDQCKRSNGQSTTAAANGNAAHHPHHHHHHQQAHQHHQQHQIVASSN